MFVNYAHRGASEYCPENTMLAFYTGIYMGANGIETDVRRAKDGTLILFHDGKLDRVTDGTGAVSAYTWEELAALRVHKNELQDRIVTFEDFLQHFAFRDITFAIELKGEGVEHEVADLIYRYGVQDKCVVTSFQFDYIRELKRYAPELEIGYLTKDTSDELLENLKQIGCTEYCPKADTVTPENVEKWHAAGFRVRAWGVSNEALMRSVYDSGADGMTINFPDKLVAYMEEKN